MADFPTVLHVRGGSTRRPVAGILNDRADDGKLRTRSLYAATSYQFDLQLLCYASDRTAVFDHFAAHTASEFSYTWPDGDVAYTVRYASEPYDSQQGDGNWWYVTVSLEGVAA